MRQALAGMLWSKQYYYFNADTWLEEHRAHPLHSASRAFRNLTRNQTVIYRITNV